MKPIKHLYQIAISIALTTMANASIASAPVTNWTGVFIGPQVSYSWGSLKSVFPNESYYSTDPGQGFSANPQGSTLGGHLALNRQICDMVMGLEASYNGGSITQNRTGVVASVFPNDFYTSKIDSVTTITARLGYAHNKWLAYGRGGFALAHTSLNAVSGEPGAGVIANAGTTQKGWTIGAGLEYMLIPTIVLGLQYDFIELNNSSASATTTGTIPGMSFNVNMKQTSLNAITASVGVKIL